MIQKEHPFKAIRRAGIPLVVWESADPTLSIKSCTEALLKSPAITLQWDVSRGLIALATGNKEIDREAARIKAELSPDGPISTSNPAECLMALDTNVDKGIVKGCVVYFHMADRYVTNESVCQSIWNLRDKFKGSGNTLVMMCQSMVLPEALKQDCVVITEPLPNELEIRGIMVQMFKDAGYNSKLSNAEEQKIVDTLLGLSSFAAEQVLAMSLTPTGVDMNGLWDRKRMMIEQTPGLSVWRGGETFDQIGGCNNVKNFTRSILNGRAAPRAICFIDEIEKTLAGAQGDTSGVSQDYLGTLLAWMQNKEATGMIFIGPPGAAKSAIAKAAGNEANIPTIQMDLGGMKGSLVGESEKRLRLALQVIDAVAQGQALFIATCNSISSLPPELRRRFTLGTFFFDLPTMDERAAIWKIYCKKYEIDDKQLPNDLYWTGAEIKQCCATAWRLKISLRDASKFIVPVYKSAGDAIENLRKQAHERFISAGEPGLYQRLDFTAEKTTSRKFNN